MGNPADDSNLRVFERRLRTIDEGERAMGRQLRAYRGFVVCEKVASIHNSLSQRSTDRGEAVSSIDVEEEIKVGAYLKTKPEEERIDKCIDHFD